MTISEQSRGARAALLGLALALGLAAGPGCGAPEEGEARLARRTMPVEEVPAEAMEVAEGALPGIAFNEAWANVDADGKLHSYEIRGSSEESGRIREVRVSPSGEILEME